MDEDLASKVLVILLGRKDSGKGTVTEIIKGQIPGQYATGVTEIALAEHLKKSVATIFDWNEELLRGGTAESREWREQKEPEASALFGKQIVPRVMLVRIGALLKEAISPNFFLAITAKKISQCLDNVIVISDGRFIHEYEYLLKKFKKVVVCSITSNRAIAPYRDKLRNYVLECKESWSQLSPKNSTHPSKLERIHPACVEQFLRDNGVFEDEAELAEWETVLMQEFPEDYIPAWSTNGPPLYVSLVNNSTKDALANEAKLLLKIIGNML